MRGRGEGGRGEGREREREGGREGERKGREKENNLLSTRENSKPHTALCRRRIVRHTWAYNYVQVMRNVIIIMYLHTVQHCCHCK